MSHAHAAKVLLSRRFRTIVKPLWRLPPSKAKTLRSSTNISQTKNVALKSPKISLIKGYFGDLRATFLRSLLENYFSMSFWVSWGFWVTGALQSFFPEDFGATRSLKKCTRHFSEGTVVVHELRCSLNRHWRYYACDWPL